MRAVPVSDRVTSSRHELHVLVLADRLADPTPVCPQGVAQARLLLMDGSGPLYNPRSHADLCDQAESAAADLSI